MSVILDALRRARRQNGAPSAPRAGMTDIPAGLLASGIAKPPAPPAPRTRWPLLLGVVAAAAMIWGGVRFGLPLLLPASNPGATVATNISPTNAPLIDTAATNAVPAPAAAPEQPVPATPETVAPSPAAAAPPAARRPAPPRPRPAAPRPAPPLRVAPPPLAGPAAPPPSPGSVNHFALAVQYQNLGNFEQALAHYTAVLTQDEFNVEARNNLALLYHERGLTTEAVDQFRRAIVIDPKYVRARSNLAVVLMNAGRLAEARAELRAAIALDPRNVDLLVNMALVDKADHLPDKARETLIDALGREPSHPPAHYNLAILYEEAGEMERAYAHYNDFLKFAGPEYGSRLTDVRRRADGIGSKLVGGQ